MADMFEAWKHAAKAEECPSAKAGTRTVTPQARTSFLPITGNASHGKVSIEISDVVL